MAAGVVRARVWNGDREAVAREPWLTMSLISASTRGEALRSSNGHMRRKARAMGSTGSEMCEGLGNDGGGWGAGECCCVRAMGWQGAERDAMGRVQPRCQTLDNSASEWYRCSSYRVADEAVDSTRERRISFVASR